MTWVLLRLHDDTEVPVLTHYKPPDEKPAVRLKALEKEGSRVLLQRVCAGKH